MISEDIREDEDADTVEFQNQLAQVMIAAGAVESRLSAEVVRQAILDSVDDAEYLQWMWDKDEANANSVRLEFCDTVIRRAKQLSGKE